MSAAPNLLPLRVGIQGDAGSFSHAALRTLQGDGAAPEHYSDFDAVLDALDAGAVDRVLLPVHNSLAGVVGASLKAISARDLRVDAETELPIRLCVLGLPGSSLATLRSIASHPIALGQCSRFLSYHPRLHVHAEYDTAGAARLAAERGDMAAGAIASREAAELYGLDVLAEDIQDRLDNVTRFWLLARRRLSQQSPPAAQTRTDSHLALHVRAGRSVGAIRGATTVPRDEPAELKAATHELLADLLSVNGISAADVISAIFTVTPDITSEFPAYAAREIGWAGVPLLCTSEIAVTGALPRCLRVLLHVERREAGWMPRHVYLREAHVLRPDLVRG